ncbi:hypothetical protein Tco_1175213 [Tanacetum coccineum]
MESVKKSIDKRALHKREYDNRANERQMHTTKEKVDTSTTLDASLVDTESNGTESKEQDTSRQHHTEQLEFNNEGEVDQNAKKGHDTRPLSAKLTNNQTTKISNQSLKSENICLKKTVAQFQNDFLRMEAHCVNLELKYQNQALKEGQHGQFSKVKSNEAKHYKDLYDSIKITRAKTIEHTTSLITKKDEFKAQLQEKGFSIAALKNELRKLTGNSVNTKFSKSSILGKPVLQPHRNQSVVRQSNAFKSERPRISKPRFASQVDVNKDLPKPVTSHYFPKERESAFAKPHHVIASSNFRNSLKNMPRFSSNDMVHNHYIVEAKNKTQDVGGKPERGKIFKTVVLRWVPTGKIFTSSTTKVDSEPTNGSNKDITNQYECEKLLMYKQRCCSLIPAESYSLPHTHAQTTKTYYKHQDSRIKKAQELKTKTSENSDIKDNSSKTKHQGRILERFQEDAKCEHVGQDTRSQGGKDDQDKQGKD